MPPDPNEKFEQITATLALPEDKDPWSYENLSKMDYSRDKFSYQHLINIGMWPDRILQFIQINRLAYIDVMHLHHKYSKMFDKPLRDFVKWLRATKSSHSTKFTELKNSFLNYEDTKISNAYWDQVLREDNCYMYQLEEESAKRSSNEDKHYKLFKLVKLALTEDLYDDNRLKVYVALYDLRGGHARVDDYYRKSLYNFMTDKDFSTDIEIIPFELPEELEVYIGLCSQAKDEDILTKLAMFRNILRYFGYQILSFKQVFLNKEIDVFEDLLDVKREEIKESSYTYKYFWEKIENKDVQDKLIIIGSSVETILNIQQVQKRKRLQTPSYTVYTNGKHSGIRLTPEVEQETRKRSRSFGYYSKPPTFQGQHKETKKE